MTAKKKVIPISKGNGMTSELTRQEFEKHENKKSVQIRKPLFSIPVVEKRVVKRDLNYYGIKQYLKNRIGLDLFKKLTNGDKKEKAEKPKKENFDYQKYYEDMNQVILNCWGKYCVWWFAHVRR